ncbi:DEAD/DEAH box helicase [Streptomyces sp. HB2AG]|uniref:DEAD/DEAH box helicase n=1 Tax=Streptomyces sp. HB2AG TaxID=2983400 RepID=UPI0022AA707D|nr:DEAD/DEAH box helicase [Streptomyces sp. HB2AG]MCZ2524380.1 DEAD/DEAH box helicase [Streptomyces sp. HB2AG]
MRRRGGVAFKRGQSDSAGVPSDPEQLYRLLARGNRGPASVWGHQSKVMEHWHKEFRDKSDVALELPTGAGKTLVGSLIAEYLRRAEGRRVAYLCPTRQLAVQTARKLDDYGIPSSLLIGQSKGWDQVDLTRFQAGGSIAVSTYSHVFNSRPRIDAADVLILDDAHAAEGYVAKPWSLRISRRSHESAYKDVLAALSPALDPLLLPHLRSENPGDQYRTGIYLASPVAVAAQANHVESVIRDAVAHRKVSEDVTYAWKFLETHVADCMVYVSYREILIRPLIVPTFQHEAFNSPKQRIYMSATLGAGGELERAFGRRRIHRIPVPAGWDKEGTGRRLFVFPEIARDLASDPKAVAPFVRRIVEQAGRAVVLTPETRVADKFREHYLPENYRVFTAQQVEDDLAAFTSQPAAALVLTNRYDGVDLPNDDCRLVVLTGLPAKGDLQERFLYESVGADEVLRERIRARIQQGAGRATRNLRDHAVVLVLGRSLTSYLARRDIQASMHPEIHAELEVGVEASLDQSSEDVWGNLAIFNEQGPDWQGVEEDIVRNRETYDRQDGPGAAVLQQAVRSEVAAANALWSKDHRFALTAIKGVTDQLRNAQTPKRYSSLWSYLGFCVAHRLAEATGETQFQQTAASYFGEARRNSLGTRWFDRVASVATPLSVAVEEVDPTDEAAMSTILAAKDLWRPEAFQAALSTRVGLQQTDPDPYEDGLVHLGRLAGASKSYGDPRDGGAAKPDAVWIFGSARWVVWEAKNQARETGEIGADQARQAGGHRRTTEKAEGVVAPGDSICVLASPKKKVNDGAYNVAEENLYWVRPPQVLALFDTLTRAWQDARARGVETMSTTELAAVFREHQALPSQWLPTLRQYPLWRTPED